MMLQVEVIQAAFWLLNHFLQANNSIPKKTDKFKPNKHLWISVSSARCIRVKLAKDAILQNTSQTRINAHAARFLVPPDRSARAMQTSALESSPGETHPYHVGVHTAGSKLQQQMVEVVRS